MAGELTLSVVLWTLLGVGVEDDAVSGAGDDLLTICVGHELCAEDVCPMTWAYWVFDLQQKLGNHMIAVWMEEHMEAIISYDLPFYCTGYWWPERCHLTPRGCIHQCRSSKLCWPAEFGIRLDSHAKNVSFRTNHRKLLWSWIMTSWILQHPQNQLWWNISRQGVVSKFKQVTD